MDLSAVGALNEFLAKEYGGLFDPKETIAATGAGFTSVVGNDPDGMALLFINVGANGVFLSLHQDTPASTGIFLAANGGFASLNPRDDFTLPSREWFASSPVGGSTLFILRLRRFSRG